MDFKKQLYRLTQIGISLSEERDVDRLFDKILKEARRFTNAEAGTLYIREGAELKFAVTQNKRDDAPTLTLRTASLRGYKVPIDKKSMAGYVAMTGKTLNIEDVYKVGPEVEYCFNDVYDKKENYRSQSMLIFPLRAPSGKVLGVLQLINARDEDGAVTGFSDSYKHFMQALASQAAVALENAQLNENLKSAYLDTIFRLAMAAEYRDNETGFHVKRMSNYSAVVAERMHLPDDFVERILYASPMHDIGKIGIPDRILKKEGPLTSDEFEIMKLHTTYGAKILGGSSSDILELSREIALCHHEKWNGKGYPKQLKGEDIPLSGRIVAVADVFDALTSKRCYKEAYPVEKALKMLEEDRGRYFDPTALDAFMDGLDDILQIKANYTDESEEEAA